MGSVPAIDAAITEVTPDQFIAIWEAKDDIKLLHPQYFHEEQGPNGTTVQSICFENIQVTGNIHIANKPSRLKTLHITKSILKNFRIENCQADHINITAASIQSDLDIVGANTHINYLKVAGCEFKSLALYDGAKCNTITIEENKGEPNLLIEHKGSNPGYLKLLHAKIGMLELCKGATIDEIDIDNSILRYIKLFENSIVDNLQITNHSVCLSLELESLTINERLTIEESTIHYFWFQVKALLEGTITNSIVQVLKYKTNASTVLNISKSKLIEFSLQRMRTGKDGLIQLIDCEVNTLQFDTVLNLASINIKDIVPLKSIRRYRHYPGKPGDGIVSDWYEMEDFTGKAQINIFNADIGKTMFSSNLSGFDKFCFSNSKIIEAFIAGPKLPNIYTREGENADEQKRMAYNQIKRIYENRGDTITAMKYYRLEMEIYRRQLDNKQEDKIPGERFQLLFNQLTNRHGTEWQIPLILTLSLSIILYVAYCVVLFGFSIRNNFDWRLVPYYFEFLNPTHKVNFLKEFTYTTNTPRDNIALIIDTLCRIAIPLLLYQMIQAFRKYGRK